MSGETQEGAGTMPGKPFRSSLEPHFDEIAQRRARRETWQSIAAELAKTHGLKVHFSAVQKFFGRYQTRRSQPLGFAPLVATKNVAVAKSLSPSAHEAGGEEAFGCGETIHPDDENPFLMRKRQAQPASPPSTASE